MTTKLVAHPRQRHVLVPLAIGVGIFIVADVLLISRPWFLETEPLLVAMAVPLSQCSLAALWAAGSRASLYVRFSVPLVGAIASWYVLTRMLPWGIGEPASAAWALALAIQALAIVMLVNLYDRGCSFLARRRSLGDVDARNQLPEKKCLTPVVRSTRRTGPRQTGSDTYYSAGPESNRAPFAFDLRTLMLWTTVIALAFGFVQYARVRWQWTSSIADWEFLEAMPIIGLFNALVAVLWLWALALGSWQKRVIKSVSVLTLMGVLGLLLPSAVEWITGTAAIEARDCLVLAGAQSVFVASAIGLVRIAGRQPVATEISEGAPSVTQ